MKCIPPPSILYRLCKKTQFIAFFCFLSHPDVAREREVDGDLLESDLGDGLPFRAGAFDGAISISALQWLCNADKRYHKPHKRLFTFFSSLYACLVRRGIFFNRQ